MPRLPTIVALLVAGFVINAVVALGICYVQPAIVSHDASPVVSVPSIVSAYVSIDGSTHWYASGFGTLMDTYGRAQSKSVTSITASITYHGWPWPSFHGAFLFGNQAGPVGAILTPRWWPDMGFGQRLIPLRPSFPGTIFNTIFYAFVCWLALVAVQRMVARRRRRARLCVRCAHPLAGLVVCPECGTGAS